MGDVLDELKIYGVNGFYEEFVLNKGNDFSCYESRNGYHWLTKEQN